MKSVIQILALTSILSGLISAQHIQAQGAWEFSMNGGASNFLGDLGGNPGRGTTFIKDNNFSMTRMMKGINISYNSHLPIAFRFAVNVGRLEGADSVIVSTGGLEEARAVRNQHFRSPLLEAYAAIEFSPTALFAGLRDDLQGRIRPYGILGIGVFHFNPQGEYIDPATGQSTWVNLRDLRTEGQGMGKYPNRKEYSLTQINIPYGVGLKYYITHRYSIGFEIVTRKTFTDYIDDVSTSYIDAQDFYDFFGAGTEQAKIASQMANKSQFLYGSLNRAGYAAGDKRGTPTNNDAYYSSTIKLSIRLGRDNSPSYRSTYCPIIRF